MAGNDDPDKQIRLALSERIERYTVLFFDCMTPLIKKELHHAIRVHSEVLKLLPSPPDYDLDQLGDTDTIDDHLMKHWTKVHGDLMLRASLLLDMTLFQSFLTGKLLQEYTGKPYTVPPWVFIRAKSIAVHADGAADDGRNTAEGYRIHVIWPAEEMCLSPAHVQQKFRAAAKPQKYPGGEIQHLIDDCDWPNLATALCNDRELAVELFQEEPLDPECYDAHTSKKVLKRINDISSKFFEDLSSPSTYTLTKHAVQQSATRASGTLDPTSPTVQHPIEEPSSVGGAKGLYDKFVSGLGLGGKSAKLRSIGQTASRLGVSLDEKARLIDPAKKT